MQSSNMPEWRPGPDRPTTTAACVDVWRVDPVTAGGAGRDAHAHDALRDILRRYLPHTDRDPRIVREPGGKPRLASDADLHFNLSHCRDLALIAVAQRCAVGIDVESRRDIDDPLRLAARVFRRSDLARLEMTAEAHRNEAFLDLWTQLEARQKTVGRGIFAAPVAPATLQCRRFRPTPAHYACVCWEHPGHLRAIRYFAYSAAPS